MKFKTQHIDKQSVKQVEATADVQSVLHVLKRMIDLVKDWTAKTQHMQCQWAVAVACMSCSQPA